MNESHRNSLASAFQGEAYEAAISAMESITLDHVMARSQGNLDNTLTAIVQLSRGDLEALLILVEAAKQDFRDVIYWAVEESKNMKK